MRGRVREVVTYLQFHENRPRGLEAVEGRKSPSPIDLARGLYNSWACTTVQTVNHFVANSINFDTETIYLTCPDALDIVRISISLRFT